MTDPSPKVDLTAADNKDGSDGASIKRAVRPAEKLMQEEQAER